MTKILNDSAAREGFTRNTPALPGALRRELQCELCDIWVAEADIQDLPGDHGATFRVCGACFERHNGTKRVRQEYARECAAGAL